MSDEHGLVQATFNVKRPDLRPNVTIDGVPLNVDRVEVRSLNPDEFKALPASFVDRHIGEVQSYQLVLELVAAKDGEQWQMRELGALSLVTARPSAHALDVNDRPISRDGLARQLAPVWDGDGRIPDRRRRLSDAEVLVASELLRELAARLAEEPLGDLAARVADGLAAAPRA